MNESVQWAVLTPAVMAVLLGGLQAGVSWHARQVAQQAADAAVEAAAVAGPHASGTRVAHAVAEQGDLQEVSVSFREGGAVVEATVTGRALSLCPPELCPSSRVSAHASFPKERR